MRNIILWRIPLKILMHTRKNSEMLLKVTLILSCKWWDSLLQELKVEVKCQGTGEGLGVWIRAFLQMLSTAKPQISRDSSRSWQLSGGPSSRSQVSAPGSDFIEKNQESTENKTLVLGTVLMVLKTWALTSQITECKHSTVNLTIKSGSLSVFGGMSHDFKLLVLALL